MANIRVPRWMLWLVGITALLGIVRMNVETRGDRIAITGRILDLQQRLKENSNDTQALTELIKILQSNWGFAKTYACVALGELGPVAKPALDDLILALDCGIKSVEREAAMALGEVGQGTDRAVSALIKKLESGWDSAWFSAEALGKIGSPYADSAIPALQRAAKSSDDILSDYAKKSLKALNAPVD